MRSLFLVLFSACSLAANASTVALKLSPDLYSLDGAKAEIQLNISGPGISYGDYFSASDLNDLVSSQSISVSAILDGEAYIFQVTAAAGELYSGDGEKYLLNYWSSRLDLNLVETQSSPGVETSWELYSTYVENGWPGCGNYDFCFNDYGVSLVQSGGESFNYTGKSAAAFVPVPAAVWLFGSALAGLGWIRRRRAA